MVVFSGETDVYAAFPGTLSSSDKVFCSICEILDNVIRQNIQLRLLMLQASEVVEKKKRSLWSVGDVGRFKAKLKKAFKTHLDERFLLME